MFYVLLVCIIILLLLYSSDANIPKIIHQTAPADTSKWKKEWFECQESWKKLHPDFEYKMWTDEDLDDFMKTEYPEHYDMYRSYDANIKRIDAVRYFILYTYGGIYADMDYKCQHRFFEELPGDKVSIAESNHVYDEGFQNALMVSPARHSFWENVIHGLPETKHEEYVVACTGPRFLSRHVKMNITNIHTLDLKNFNPYYEKTDSPDNYRNAKTIHLNTGSWQS